MGRFRATVANLRETNILAVRFQTLPREIVSRIMAFSVIKYVRSSRSERHQSYRN